MPETPHTWTKIVCPTCTSDTGHYDLRGPLDEALAGERKAFAERGRILDLVKSMRQAIEFARCCDLSGERGWADHDSILNALDESQALLREHDRLQGGEDA